MATYNDLEKRIDALEEQLNGIITSLNNNKKYTDADIDGCRQVENTNTSGINENSEGILDIADLADENSMAITDIADYIAELEARIEELEGKVNG